MAIPGADVRREPARTRHRGGRGRQQRDRPPSGLPLGFSPPPPAPGPARSGLSQFDTLGLGEGLWRRGLVGRGRKSHGV